MSATFVYAATLTEENWNSEIDLFMSPIMPETKITEKYDQSSMILFGLYVRIKNFVLQLLC